MASTVRLNVVEDAVLSALQSKLLTPDLVTLFAEEFTREVDRLTLSRGEADDEARRRLSVLEVEIGNLAQHFLTGTVSPTLSGMLADREAEKERLLRQINSKPEAQAAILPHPALVKRYEEKVAKLRQALNDEVVRVDAIAILRSLIDVVTVHFDADGNASLEVAASTATLIDFAQTQNAPRSQTGGRSATVVAGTGIGQNLRKPQDEMVAGPGVDQNLPGSQVEMVAGGRNHQNLRTQKSRPIGAADVRDIVSQVEMVAGARNHLNLLFRAAA